MFVDCIRCGNCCGHRRESALGDWSFEEDQIPPESAVEVDGLFVPPVDEDGTCAYMVKLNNGFTECSIHENKPKMCALYNCLTEKKAKYLTMIVKELQAS